MHSELFTIPGIGLTIRGYGAMVVLAFVISTWWMMRRASRVKADPDIMLNLALIAMIGGWIGARGFYVVHYWGRDFAHNPMRILNIFAGGFEVYGGLICATLFSLLYLAKKKLSIRLYTDIAIPAIVLGMGIGRIGCFLHGCCWGGPCPANLPWAVQFPYGSPPHVRQWQNRQATLPAELIFINEEGQAIPLPGSADITRTTDKIAKQLGRIDKGIEKAFSEGKQARVDKYQAVKSALQASVDRLSGHTDRFRITGVELDGLAASPAHRSTPIHPAQIYGAIGPLLLAWLLGAYFHRRKRHGTVFALAMIVYPVQRFVEEIIRIDNPRDTFGLTASQGVSVVLVILGVVYWLALQKMPLRSPRAVAYVPTDESEAPPAAPKADPDTAT